MALAYAVACVALTDTHAMSEDQLDLLAYQSLQTDDLGAATAAFDEMLARDEADAFAHVWLGLIAVRNGDLVRAEAAFSAAVSKVEARMEASDAAERYAASAKKAQMEQNLRHVRERLASSQRPSCAVDGALRVDAIPRVHRDALGHARFVTEFATPRVPVIIEGFEGGLAEPYWSLAQLRSVCGDAAAPMRRHAPGATSWAALAEHGARTFGDYLDELGGGTAGADFVFDWPLRPRRTGCPALLEGLGVPSYFTDGTIAAFGPALFAQPNGTQCGLHVDSHCAPPHHHHHHHRAAAMAPLAMRTSRHGAPRHADQPPWHPSAPPARGGGPPPGAPAAAGARAVLAPPLTRAAAR